MYIVCFNSGFSNYKYPHILFNKDQTKAPSTLKIESLASSNNSKKNATVTDFCSQVSPFIFYSMQFNLQFENKAGPNVGFFVDPQFTPLVASLKCHCQEGMGVIEAHWHCSGWYVVIAIIEAYCHCSGWRLDII